MVWDSSNVPGRLVLTSLFCLVSSNQSAHAGHDQRVFDAGKNRVKVDSGRERKNLQRAAGNADRSFKEAIRAIRDARRDDNRLDRVRFEGELRRNSIAPRQKTAIEEHQANRRMARVDSNQIDSNQNDRIKNIAGTVIDTSKGRNRIDLDLTSTQSSIILGKNLFGKVESVVIKVGDSEQTFKPGSAVTAAQYVAIRQKLDGGSQLLEVNKHGAASGGEFTLESVLSRKVDDLVIASGVSGLETFSKNERVGVKGDITNFGSIVFTSADNNDRGGVLFSRNISNADGATIYSTGDITFSLGEGNLSNLGVITSAHGSINIATSSKSADVVISAETGTFEALKGSINVRDLSFKSAADVHLKGGNYLSNSLNIYSGSGHIEGIVGDVTGTLNTRAGIEHFYAATETLRIGDNCITGDPTFANTTGDIQIVGLNSFGEAVAFLANGNITADSGAQIVANGFNVYMVAGAAVSVSAGPETGTVPGAPIGAGTTATVDFTPGAGNGGYIDLQASTAGIIIDTGSATGDGGNVVLAAVANGAVGGTIRLNPAGTISTGSTFTDGSGGDVSVFAGASPASPAATIELGSVNASAGPGTGSGGTINIVTAQPAATGGAAVTFDSLGQISAGGPIVAGSAATNAGITTLSLTNSATSGAGDVSITASGDVTTGAITAANDVSIAGTSVSPASILAGGDIGIVTPVLNNTGSMTSTGFSGAIVVQNAGALRLEGSGSFSLTGGGFGNILLDADLDQVLSIASSHTFNPGAGGTVTFLSEDEGGSIEIAAAITLTINDGGDLVIGAPLVSFLGDGTTIDATMASQIVFTSGGGTHPLIIALPDNGAATVVTGGGTIDLRPTDGMDLVLTNPGSSGVGTFNLMGGPVSTNTVAASTFIESDVALHSDNALTMGAAAGGGISGLSFQPYVGDWFVDGSGTPQLPFFNSYSYATVKALLQRLKDDGHTHVSTYSQGSFVFAGQFFDPTTATAGSNKFIIQAAHELGMTVSAGAFQQDFVGDNFNIDRTRAEVQYILSMAQKYPGTVTDIIVANESIVGPNSLNQLIELINEVKTLRNGTPVSAGSSETFNANTLPITTRQIWGVLAGVDNISNPLQAQLKTLIEACENHIYGNMYAYFDASLPDSYPTGPNDKANYVNAVIGSMNGTLNAFRAAFTNQSLSIELRIGETGWPTSGLRAPGSTPPFYTPAPALSDVTLAAWHLEAMKQWSASNNILTTYFNGYDQPFQTVPAAQVPSTPGSSEGFFGLYRANGTSSPDRATWTLSSIDYKLASGGVANAAMISNAGTITADHVEMNTAHLANSGLISALDSTGGVEVSSSSSLKLSGTGTITRTGGGAGSIAFTTIGANELLVEGIQTLDAGAGNRIDLNATNDGASVVIGQNAVINLPTNNTDLSINTEHLTYNGAIQDNGNPGTTIVINGADSTTIANSVGNLDLAGIDGVNVATGHLALLAKGSIINTGEAVDLNLSSGTGAGGDLLMISGFSFETLNLGSADPFFALEDVSTSTGSIILNQAGSEININTSGATAGGRVEAYANGSIAFNNINTQGGTGAGGDVIARAQGIVAGQIDTTSASSAGSGNVDIQSGTVDHNSVDVFQGVIDNGAFSILAHGGNISIASLNAAQGSALLQTDQAGSTISVAAMPVAHNLSMLAGAGTLSLPSNVVSVVQDGSGNGGMVLVSAGTFDLGGSPLILNAIATGAGNGGLASYTNTNAVPLIVDSSLVQINAAGVNGGSAIITAGGDMLFNPNGVINAAPTGPDGNGNNIGLIAGAGGIGILLVNGDLDADASGTGAGGTITLGSNSEITFTVSSAKAKNGVLGSISFDGATPGSLSVSNRGGGISIVQDFASGIFDITLDTSGAAKGDISLKTPIAAENSVNLSTGGKGKLASKLLTAPNVNLESESKTIKQPVDTTVLSANSQESIKIKNINAGPVTLGNSSAGTEFYYSGSGGINTAGDITALTSIVLTTSDGDIVIGANLSAATPKKGIISLKTTGAGSIVNATPGGADSAQAARVVVRSTTGSIGSGTAIGTALRISAESLSAETAGLTNLHNLGANTLSIARAGSNSSFTLTSHGTVVAGTRMASATDIVIDTTPGAGDIVLSNSLGGQTQTQSITLITDTGSIIAKAALNAAVSASLQSLAGGDIGSAADRLKVNAPQLSANTSASGIVNLSSRAKTAVTLGGSGSGGDFVLHARGGVSLNDVAVENGAIVVVSERGQLATANGARLTAASAGAAGSGSITLQAASASKSSIIIGNGTDIATSGAGGGDVSIFIGANPPPAVNPLTPGVNGNITVVTSGGGEVFADLSTIIANAPNNTLNAIAKNVFMAGTAANPIVVDGAVTITADPPFAVTPLVVPLRLASSGNVLSEPSSPMVTTASAEESHLQSSTPAVLNTDFANLQSSIARLDTLSSYSSLTVPEETQFLKTRKSSSEDTIEASFHHVRATHNIELQSGNLLVAAESDATVVTPNGTVSIAADSLVLVMLQTDALSVFNLHDSRRHAVVIKSGKHNIALHPGQHATVTSGAIRQFHLINPAESIDYRLMRARALADGHVFTSEFSIPSVLASTAVAKKILTSQGKSEKRIAGRLFKTTAVLSALDHSIIPYAPVKHPRLAVLNNDDSLITAAVN